MKTKTDVLIVGAGPTGLALATALQQAGIDHLLIDRLEAGLNLSRAGVIHAHTLEMLEPLGVVPQMLAAGVFDAFKPEAIFGLHVFSTLPAGTVGVRGGPLMADSDRFSIKIRNSLYSLFSSLYRFWSLPFGLSYGRIARPF